MLAGGAGTRLGGGKPVRPFAGRRLLDHAAAAAVAAGAPWAISVRRDAEFATGSGAPVLFDPPDIEGPLAGLYAGLAWAERSSARALLTIPVDTPFVPADFAQRLEAVVFARGAPAAVAASAGLRHPACALWSTALREPLTVYAGSGRRSLHGFAESVGAVEVEWPVLDHDPFFNVNTAADLAAAERAHDAAERRRLARA